MLSGITLLESVQEGYSLTGQGDLWYLNIDTEEVTGELVADRQSLLLSCYMTFNNADVVDRVLQFKEQSPMNLLCFIPPYRTMEYVRNMLFAIAIGSELLQHVFEREQPLCRNCATKCPLKFAQFIKAFKPVISA